MKNDKTPLLVLIATFVISTIVLFAGIPQISIMTLLVTCLSGVLIIQGIVTIPNKPPHIGLLTRLGKRIWKDNKTVILGEGLNWILLKGIIFDVILISKERRQKEINPQKILTPNNVDLKIPISLAWNIDEETCDEFIKIGGDAGVDTHIASILEGRLREYSRHPEEGPQTWKEMLASEYKTLDVLAKALCQDDNNIKNRKDDKKDDEYSYFEQIHKTIPTAILLDWHRENNPPNAIVREKWGDGKKFEEGEEWDIDWPEKFEDRWKKLIGEIKKPKNSKIDFHELIKKRIGLLDKLRSGRAKIKIGKTGAYLQRLTIGEIGPYGEIYEADIKLQKEQRERASETYEVNTDVNKAIILQKALKESNPNISVNECMEMIMKWKMISAGKGFIYDGALGNFARLGDLISSIMKGGKS